MIHTDKQEWLSSLKVGDEVCIHSRWRGYEILVIEKITPTRQIKTQGGYTFKNGYYDGYQINPVTDIIRKKIRYSNMLSKVKNLDFEKCSLDQLEDIVKIINSGGNGNESETKRSRQE